MSKVALESEKDHDAQEEEMGGSHHRSKNKWIV